VGRAHTWVQGEHMEVEGCACLRGGGGGTPVRGTHASGRMRTLVGKAHTWVQGERTEVGRVHTPVQRCTVVVEGAPRGKASICKRSFLLNYPQSEYID
jgi:hypothetical protein